MTEKVNAQVMQRMREMRAAGMTNQDIADITKLSLPTVRKWLGNQPFTRGGVTAKNIPLPHESVRTQNKEIKPLPEPCLSVIGRVTELVGEYKYRISCCEQSVKIYNKLDDTTEAITIAFDRLETFIKELSTIARNTDLQRTKNEAW